MDFVARLFCIQFNFVFSVFLMLILINKEKNNLFTIQFLYYMDADAFIDRLNLIQCDIPLFMLMVLTVSTNQIRKELCHWKIIGIMQIVTRRHFYNNYTFHTIHAFSFLTVVHSEAWPSFLSFMWYSLFSVSTLCCF